MGKVVISHFSKARSSPRRERGKGRPFGYKGRKKGRVAISRLDHAKRRGKTCCSQKKGRKIFNMLQGKAFLAGKEGSHNNNGEEIIGSSMTNLLEVAPFPASWWERVQRRKGGGSL